MKKLVFILFVVFVGMSQAKVITVHLKSGEKVRYTIEDIRKITFDDTGLSVLDKFDLSKKPISDLLFAPNPFSSSIQLSYNLSIEGFVTIKFFNSTGRLVKTINEGNQAKGSHTVIWNGLDESGQNQSTGYYICQIITHNTTETIKLIKLK